MFNVAVSARRVDAVDDDGKDDDAGGRTVPGELSKTHPATGHDPARNCHGRRQSSPEVSGAPLNLTLKQGSYAASPLDVASSSSSSASISPPHQRQQRDDEPYSQNTSQRPARPLSVASAHAGEVSE